MTFFQLTEHNRPGLQLTGSKGPPAARERDLQHTFYRSNWASACPADFRVGSIAAGPVDATLRMAPQFIEVRLMNLNPTSPMADRWSCVGRRLWLVWLMITPLATTPAWGDPGDDAYKFAAGLYQNSRWDLAADKFRAFIQTHPKHPKLPQARLYLGLSLVNLEKFADARTQLRQFVTLYPKSRNLADAAYRVAECSYLLNDYRAAEREFSQFLGLAPDHELTEWALPYLGDTLLQSKKMTLAAAAFQESLKKHPDGRMADDARFGLA